MGLYVFFGLYLQACWRPISTEWKKEEQIHCFRYCDISANLLYVNFIKLPVST